IRVHQDQKSVIGHRFSVLINLIEACPREQESQEVGLPFGPVLLCHLQPIRTQPQYVFTRGPFYLPALKKLLAMEDGMPPPQRDQGLREVEEAPVLGLELPIEPSHFIVLAVGIVIAPLALTERVACKHHGYALGQKQGRHHISFLPRSQGVYLGIVRWS